jgi:hypothetical protein
MVTSLLLAAKSINYILLRKYALKNSKNEAIDVIPWLCGQKVF